MAEPYEIIKGQFMSVHFNQQAGRWLLELSSDGQNMVLDLDITDPEDYMGAEAEATEFAISGAPPVEQGEWDGKPSVFLEDKKWFLHLPCPQDTCQGFPLLLDVPCFSNLALENILSPSDFDATMRLEQAKARATSYSIAKAHAHSHCLNCKTKDYRDNLVDSASEMVWYDVVVQQWQLYQPFEGGGISMPLDLYGFNHSRKAVQTEAQKLSPDFLLP